MLAPVEVWRRASALFSAVVPDERAWLRGRLWSSDLLVWLSASEAEGLASQPAMLVGGVIAQSLVVFPAHDSTGDGLECTPDSMAATGIRPLMPICRAPPIAKTCLPIAHP